ncbi:hypothetical protein NLM24_05370 [Nocardia zapadnayensis]|uniref:hypothetical protein n=1 Tax=Nocardia rhamnosiphila TaxID=426716 RepID=UPI002247D827|nr:hypothetical protein [Nocardia zapadnayensis]MCX0270143.1 hypothetical protein [Nocardia zapadnayensis]
MPLRDEPILLTALYVRGDTLGGRRVTKAAWATEREERLAHLDRLPGKDHHERFEALNRTSRLFATNGIELSKHISTFVGTLRHVDELSEDFQHETVRLFHNYIASVTTLRDVQRSTHRKIWPERLPEGERRDAADSRTVWEAKNYEPKVAELFGDEDIRFLFDLRNFTVHYAVPVMSIGTTWRHKPPSSPEWINTIELKRSELEKFSRWSAPAKRFLKTQTSDVEFLPLLEKYSKRARAFYGWFWEQAKEAVCTEVDEYHSKSNELGHWLAEVMAKPDFEPHDGGRPIPGSLRRNRALAHTSRCAFGTTGWAPISVDSDGCAVTGKSDWDPLPQVGKYAR